MFGKKHLFEKAMKKEKEDRENNKEIMRVKRERENEGEIGKEWR